MLLEPESLDYFDFGEDIRFDPCEWQVLFPPRRYSLGRPFRTVGRFLRFLRITDVVDMLLDHVDVLLQLSTLILYMIMNNKLP
jgi:hypothetical protein